MIEVTSALSLNLSGWATKSLTTYSTLSNLLEYYSNSLKKLNKFDYLCLLSCLI